MQFLYWFNKASDLYRDTSNKLNGSIGGSDILLPGGSNIVLQTQIAINMQIKSCTNAEEILTSVHLI